MNLPASVGDSERARLFCGLRLPDRALDTLSEWQAEHIEQGRPVPRDHLHVTLAFLGHRPVEELESILGALREAAAAAGPDPARAGALPGDPQRRDAGAERPRRPGDPSRRGLARSSGASWASTSASARPWLPHLTVVRFRERPRLQPPLPDLGEVSPSDAAAYHSVLRSSGAQYVVVESFALGG